MDYQDLTLAFAANSENKVRGILNQMQREAADTGLSFSIKDPDRLSKLIAERLKLGLSPLPLGYKGVSFNPWGKGIRESFLLLDFFSLLARFIEKFNQEIWILDASFYWMINESKEIVLISSPSAQKAASQLLKSAKAAVNEESLSYQTALLRNKYLRAIAEVFPKKRPRVFSMLDIWQSKAFLPYLEAAFLRLCSFDPALGWKVASPILYHRYKTYSNWFTPLVAAEQAFLVKVGVGCIFSPSGESSWNEMADEFCGKEGCFRLNRLYYKRPTNIWYENYQRLPAFDDTLSVLQTKLKKPAVSKWMAQLIAPFANSLDKEGEVNVSEKLFYFAQKVNEKVESFSGRFFPTNPML